MKKKLMAFILAAGLGITAITAQATEANVNLDIGCVHKHVTVITRVKETINWNGNCHYIVYETQYCCPDCRKVIDTEYEATYEPHNYEQIYYDNGAVLSYCTDCDDSFYW